MISSGKLKSLKMIELKKMKRDIDSQIASLHYSLSNYVKFDYSLESFSSDFKDLNNLIQLRLLIGRELGTRNTKS